MHIESLKTDSRISCEFISNQSKESNLYYDALRLGKFPSRNEMLMSSTQINYFTCFYSNYGAFLSIQRCICKIKDKL